ncbi:MAG: toprim domain-containing protein [Steroidobacteraceae bacterium]
MRTRRSACPVCDRGPRDTALAITTDERGTVSYCHRCGYTTSNSIERRPIEPIRSVPPKSAGPLDWSDRAEAIWRRTVTLRWTVGQTYLERRGCVVPPADGDLRFLPPAGPYQPTLCARITDAVTARPISLHLTPLLPDGTHGERRLLAGHRKKGGVIRLWPDECVTHGLGIAEGIETALAAGHLYAPMWSTIDAGNLAAFPVPAGIDCLAIYADHDEAGLKAAGECARRWRNAGREVRVLRARLPGADIADLAACMEGAA